MPNTIQKGSEIKLILGDCLEKIKELPDNSVDSIVTDPPYELGFMGKSWDSTGIANNVEMWKECLRVLKPGGYLLSFGGTRTYHRMASAIEDAGFEVRDMIEWVYGSGFPKSLNIGKAVDKIQGNEREVVGSKTCGYQVSISKQRVEEGYRPNLTKSTSEVIVDRGTSEWEGWGTALKPAHEPICMARKPLAEKTVAENCLKWGVGGINIDGCRVGTEVITNNVNDFSNQHGNKFGNGKPIKKLGESQVVGRFPANLIHDNSKEVRECFPDGSGANGTKAGKYKASNNINFGGGYVEEQERDKGNASRFFKSIIYTSKASKKDRGEGNTHATVKPTKLIEYLINMVSRDGATILDPFMGSGTTGVACKNLNRNFIGIELDPTYFKIAKKRIENL